MVKELIFNKILDALKDTEKAQSIQAGQKTHKIKNPHQNSVKTTT